MRKQIISLLVAILVFVAMVPAAFAANNQQLAARLEGDSTTSSLVLLDEVCVATDSYGNSYVINPDERTWVSENTVTVPQLARTIPLKGLNLSLEKYRMPDGVIIEVESSSHYLGSFSEKNDSSTNWIEKIMEGVGIH